MPLNCSSSLFSFFHFFKRTFLQHIQLLLLDFDPVKNGQTQSLSSGHLKHQKIHLVYLFPALSMLAIAVETHCIYLQAWLRSNPELLNFLLARRLMPRSFWAQSDAIVELGIAMTTASFFCLLLETKLPLKYQMIVAQESNHTPRLLQNGHFLNASEADRILTFRGSMHRLLQGAIVTIFLIMSTFFLNCFRLTWSPEHSWIVTIAKFWELVIFSFYLQ